ncbi:MAG: winged helix-turn-helix transcriptional regulator [Verrucomicrobiales bacterium]|nr:winged helix-turn-helix transcriptional regulator [Verrucomicrobiales bacterium]
MITAYSANPRLSLIAESKPKPQFATLDDLIAAMKADAAQIRIKTASLNMRDTTQAEVPEEAILEVIEANPGCTVKHIAHAVYRTSPNIRTRLTAMEARGQCKVQMVKVGKTWLRTFYPVSNPPKAKNGRPYKSRSSPVRDKVMAFIKANPGCTSRDLAAHMGCTVKAASAHVSEVRKVGKVRTERAAGRGNHIPAKYWIVE